MTRTAVFGYGSLVSPLSAGQTLGRRVEAPIPARLRNWARAWTLARDNQSSEKTFAVADGTRPRYCLGLNLEPAPGAPGPNGALIELDATELERLDLREMRYERVEVSDCVFPVAAARGFDTVYAYLARPAHHHPDPPGDAIVIARYPAAIEAAFRELGPGQLELYRQTTAPAPVPVVDATLVEDRIPAGNPRDW